MKPTRHQIAAGVTVVALGALATVALASGSTPATDTAAAPQSAPEVRTEIVRETVHRRAKASSVEQRERAPCGPLAPSAGSTAPSPRAAPQPPAAVAPVSSPDHQPPRRAATTTTTTPATTAAAVATTTPTIRRPRRVPTTAATTTAAGMAAVGAAVGAATMTDGGPSDPRGVAPEGAAAVPRSAGEAAPAAPARAAARKPGPAGLMLWSLGAFFVVLAVLAVQVRAGGDPALGPAKPAAERRVIVHRVVLRRVVVTRAAPRSSAPAAREASGPRRLPLLRRPRPPRRRPRPPRPRPLPSPPVRHERADLRLHGHDRAPARARRRAARSGP